MDQSADRFDNPLAILPAAAPAANWTEERVLAIRHWTPTLLSFRTTRYRAFRFTPGHYARLGLGGEAAGQPPASAGGAGENASSTTGESASGGADGVVWRPYSMVSAATDEHLEFISVLVPGGAFSQRLAELRVGDAIRVDKAAFGFLTVDQLAPGRDLWMLASGTGLGPFVAILRDPAVWGRFERLILAHGVRRAGELAYRDEIEVLAANAGGVQLVYLPIVTREAGATPLSGRIPQLLAAGALERAAAATLSVEHSRLMVCGNPEMARELRQQLGALGFSTTRRGVPGQMAFEKYW